jgi:hypothetical protein
MIIQLYCDERHHMHKSCGIEWLQKDIENPEHLTNKSTCPLCREDFRIHKEFAEHDPNYRDRFIPKPPMPQEPIEESDSDE